ncbi:heterokaryon incompatibility protein-domain-containing protein [Annulohypoxylon truncatum]|uniref:heterokaryon incompatibility protein-domain-containing protein n=1 Tax=Annulohypoxylon truncatum TaxID=327061 RepID=UPI0020089DE9|nr:heterokaryon incompatibility protein-domain-containing protein [Annulohypoxylon truncatum]KAI1205007.1 heterokaryon incompatibility protein-domain-containing protein [Annulohypoxylon truncatum]
MRLLRTKQYRLIEADEVPDPFPQYAILSHTWISPRDEITYQDFKHRKGDIDDGIFKQRGWEKLKRYCDRASKDGWEWAWMDTCCIDKTNPADTQEAINAMFRWYQNAGICYAYLNDIEVNRVIARPNLTDVNFPLDSDLDDIASKDNVADPDSSLRQALRPLLIQAKWFTRGWTLQELLAPPYLVFVDKAWRRMGTRESWAVEIKEASRIEARYLTTFSPTDFTSCSIAMRLSWASRRETTLEEDETYSLLGLFGISLPLIYGEGRWRAFNRLQRELITVYNDDSIFAWKAEQSSSQCFHGPQRKDSNLGWGILAPSIREFWDASNVNAFGFYGYSFSMTNRGLEINAKRWRRKDDPTICLIRLNCGLEPSNHISIPLNHDYDSYNRIHIEELYYTKTINYDDWEEERGTEPTLIRVSNYSNPLVSSIFALEYPGRIKVGQKYFVDFGTTPNPELQPLDKSFLIQGLKKDELIIEPNRLVFVNIELQGESYKSQFDAVINLAGNGFPSVGILPRAEEPWERVGNPLKEGISGKYEHLADHLHYSVPTEPAYPVVAFEESENLVVGVCLLPRPLMASRFDQLSQNVNDITLREYVLKITVNGDQSVGQDMSRYPNKKRKLN